MTFSKHSLLTFWGKRPGQVRSPEAICWPHLRKVCNPAKAIVLHGSISSLQVFIRVLPCTVCISHNLYICDLRSWQMHALYITSPWENIWMRPALSKWVKTTQFFQDYQVMDYYPVLLSRIILSVMIQVSFTDRDTGKGHLRSCEVISSSLPINHDIMMLKTFKLYQTARLVKTRRLTCNMTINFAPYWVMTWPRPDIKFNLIYEGHHVHFPIVSTRETQWCQSDVSFFLSSKFI